MIEPPTLRDRLDSWKAIAEYLQRDLATVRRWEKALGLPIHRVAGTGRSVFAYQSEIDDWLKTVKAVPPAATELPGDVPAPATRAQPGLAVVLLVAVLALVAGIMARGRTIAPDDLRAEVTSAGVVARDRAGVEQWRYPFPTTSTPFLPPYPLEIVRGMTPGVLIATSYRGRQAEDRVESGALTFLDLKGRLQRSFSFADNVTFQGKLFGAPWALTSFAVNDDGGSRRIALAAHHYVWDPGIVTILDDRWQRRGTFVHAGWIEAVRWLGPQRLMIGGFSNAHDGGMIALLDGNALDGQGPEPAGSRHFCDSCGTSGPLRMFVFPRTEINRVTASPFNRVLVQALAGRVLVRTVEMPAARGDADAVYEFTSSLDLVGGGLSERYWEMHRALEDEGKITHTRDQCPDRDGPRQIRMWEPATGWRAVGVP